MKTILSLLAFHDFFADICGIRKLSTYLFAVIIFSYVFTAIGVPVYLHYCGGELEKVNVGIKTKGCCGDDEADSNGDMDGSDCCKDEHLFLQNHHAFTLSAANYKVYQLNGLALPLLPRITIRPVNSFKYLSPFNAKEPPPKRIGSLLVSCSVLII